MQQIDPRAALYLLEHLFSFTDLNLKSIRPSRVYDYTTLACELRESSNSVRDLELEHQQMIFLLMNEPIYQEAFQRLSISDYPGTVTKAIDSCFLIKMPENYHGKLLCNKKIAIRDVVYDLTPETENSEGNLQFNENLVRAGTFALFLHEFTNYAIRQSLGTFGEILEFKSPKSVQGTCTDSGYRTEEIIFGKKITHLTNSAAVFVLAGHNSTRRISKKI